VESNDMTDLLAQSLATDLRVRRAKELMLDALADSQRTITVIRPADPDRKQSYDELIRQFGVIRGGDLFYAYLGSGIGKGPLVELADGSVKYDFISGIGVHHWGHSHPAIVEACLDAALQDTVMQGNLQQNLDGIELARLLLTGANLKGADLGHCFLTTSGAMANENALKLIFQKKSPADRLLAFEGCFAGRSLAMAQITDRPAYRDGLPTTVSVDYVPFFDPEAPIESTRKAVETLERHLNRYPRKHAAMIFELVLGEGGFIPGDRDFFLSLMQVLRERNVAIFVDEIQTFGRTTELFAFQHFGLDAFVELVTIGKLSQACATLFTHPYHPRSGLLSQTFTACTAMLKAGKVIVNGLMEGGFFGPDGANAELHRHFGRRFSEMEKRHPGLITGPYGVGAMIAFTPFDGNAEKVKQFLYALFEAGIIAFYCGTDVSRVRFLVPAGAITFEQIDDALKIVEQILLEVGGAP
jgi:4-aminobutyrate aminotransferase-like enzyme